MAISELPPVAFAEPTDTDKPVPVAAPELTLKVIVNRVALPLIGFVRALSYAAKFAPLKNSTAHGEPIFCDVPVRVKFDESYCMMP
jgi:hypothetical protein